MKSKIDRFYRCLLYEIEGLGRDLNSDGSVDVLGTQLEEVVE